MIRGDDEPVIMDFGLARDVESDHRMTISGVAVGTPPYMSPEGTQGKSGDIGAWTDVWGLGAVLYHALTGRPPFDGQSDHEIFRAINDQEPKPPRAFDPALPNDLQRIVLCCLQKIPAERYASGASRSDLRAHLRGERVRVNLPGIFQQRSSCPS